MAEPKLYRIYEKRDIHYILNLSMNEMSDKLSRQVALQDIEELKPLYARLATTGDRTVANKTLGQIKRMAIKQNTRSNKNITRQLSDFVYRSFEIANKALFDNQTAKRTLTDAEQRKRAQRTSFLKGDGRVGKTVRGVERDMLTKLERVGRRIFNNPQEMKRGLNSLLADRTTTLNTVLDHSVRQAKLTAAEEHAQEYMFLTVGDDRVSDECSPLHGRIFKVGEGEEPPIHFNCRCTIEPQAKETREVLEKLQRPNDIDKWFNANRNQITKEALAHNPLSRKRGTATKTIFRNEAEAISTVLHAVRRKGVWPSTQSFLTTKNTFNDNAARRLLRQRFKTFGIDIDIPKPIRGDAPPAKRLGTQAAVKVYSRPGRGG